MGLLGVVGVSSNSRESGDRTEAGDDGTVGAVAISSARAAASAAAAWLFTWLRWSPRSCGGRVCTQSKISRILLLLYKKRRRSPALGLDGDRSLTGPTRVMYRKTLGRDVHVHVQRPLERPLRWLERRARGAQGVAQQRASSASVGRFAFLKMSRVFFVTEKPLFNFFLFSCQDKKRQNCKSDKVAKVQKCKSGRLENPVVGEMSVAPPQEAVLQGYLHKQVRVIKHG